MSIEIFRGTKRNKRVLNTSMLSDMLCEMRGIADGNLSHASIRLERAFDEEFENNRSPKGRENARDLTSEIYGKLYEDSERLESPTDSVHARIHRALESTEEFKTLKDVVDGDPDFASFVTRKLISSIYDKIPQLMKEEQQRQENKGNGGDGDQQGQGDKGQSGPPTKTENSLKRELSQASSELTKQVAEGKRMLGGISSKGGFRPGTEESVKDTTGSRACLINMLNASKDLRRVLKLAGRLRFYANAMKSKAQPSVGAITSIERGADITRILPSQFAGLTHPVLRKLTLARIASGDALQYKMEEKEKEGRGPLIILVDESGSMDRMDGDFLGVKDLEGMNNMSVANGITMAMVGSAVKQKREVTVIGFTGRICHVTHFKKGKFLTKRNPSVPDYDNMKDFISMTESQAIQKVSDRSPGGGTNFHRAMEAGFTFAEKQKKADVVIISDAAATVYESERKRFQAVKDRLGTRLFGIVIGGGTFCSDMDKILDQKVDMNKELLDGAGRILNATSSD